MRPSLPSLVNILVPVKRSIDYAVKIRVASDGKSVDTNVKHSMASHPGPPVEEAIRLKTNSGEPVSSITALSIGPAKAIDTIRTALAMGADTGIHIVTPENTIVEPLSVAHAIKAIVERSQGTDKKFDLLLMGKQAIDDDSGATGGMVAGMLGWGQGSFASKVVIEKGGKVQVTREIDGGLEKIESELPMVITTDLRLNEPRYASLPNIMKAKKKKVEALKPEDLNLDFTPRLKTISVTEPPKRTGGAKVENVQELVSKMKEAGIL
ncbi:hypothetical protein I350_08068 [Cryptococcus amylolentus CBS 6273]|uniref:Probable electron transfer flavoprotein subunit beta n=1 Tax=Cryptococcus amylolentus CBS 6273 TaxID=1296118 RepID=A0A1E3J895_9TREE|nr:hypothetical protein I350_08068 [Cryptococcus amylolentus CBS 6273]